MTPANWLDAPYNRAGFTRVPELARTERISRGEGPVLALPRAERPLEDFAFEYEGSEISLREMLESTHTNAFLVLHEGSVAFEHYFQHDFQHNFQHDFQHDFELDEESGAMRPSDTHLLMSVSKSLTAALCGVLVGRGLVATGDRVVDHIEELRGTAWEGCTVQHLLDMRTGTCWNYAEDEVTILDVSDYRTSERTDIAPDTAAWIRTIENSHEHGGPFRYVSLVTDVLGWVLSRASGERFAELFAREIWSRIGAEEDAHVLLDAAGFPIAEGGICTTLRDLGRFGQLCLEGGAVAGEQIVPAAWLARLLEPDAERIAAFGGAPEYDEAKPEACYQDCWWIESARRGIYSGQGIYGQALWVHHPSRSVVVKFSAHPAPEDQRLFALQDAGMLALCESLGGKEC